MDTKPNIFATALKYGLILGLIGSILTFLGGMFTADPADPSMSQSLLGGLIGLLAIAANIVIAVFACKNYRAENNDTMTLGEGFILTFVLFMIAAVITSIAGYIYYSYMIPDHVVESYREFMETTLEQMEGLPAFASNMATKGFDRILKPHTLLWSSVMPVALVVRALTALVIAAIMKRDAPVSDLA